MDRARISENTSIDRTGRRNERERVDRKIGKDGGELSHHKTDISVRVGAQQTLLQNVAKENVLGQGLDSRVFHST